MKYEELFVSIVMASLNGKRWLEKCFKTVLGSEYPHFEVVFVDDGSTDGSVEYLKSTFKDARIKILCNEKNLGWSAANNRGMKEARGEIIILLSNDLEVDPNWIKEIVKVMLSNSRVGVIQCNVHSLWDKGTIDSGMNYLDKYGYSYGFVSANNPEEVFFAEGMAFAFKREVMEKIGMLDEYFFMEYDDMDFSWRARLAGYKVLFVPKAIVYHAGGGTVGATYFERKPKNVSQYLRNHIVTLIKNYELKNLLKTLPVVIVIEIAKMLYFLIQKRWSFAYAVLKGLCQVARDIKLIVKKRREVQSGIREVSDKEVMKCMVPFNPKLLLCFLASEAKRKRFIIDAEPPVKG